MDLFRMNDLQGLIQRRKGLCVSVYMPAERKGTGQQNQIRFKNVLQEVEDLLKKLDRDPNKQGWFEPLRTLLGDNFFWQNQSHGLALFLADDLFRTYRLPIEFDRLVVVAERFHVKPLLYMLINDSRFYILALSQNSVRFYQCTRQRIVEVSPESLPRSLSEALAPEILEKQLQFHTGASGRQGARPAIFHGQGVVSDKDKDRILRYFRLIDNEIHDVLRDDTAPLVLAGVEYLFPIYGDANTYPHLTDQGIRGNPDKINTEKLHEDAWQIVKNRLRETLDKVFARYDDLKGTGKTSVDLKQIITEAVNGRIDSLVVAVGEQRWGLYDEGNNEIILHHQKKPGDQDLLDLAACQTLTKGGSVYPVRPEDISDGAPAIALFRY